MSLLDRPETPEDREAERDAPRPGVWAGEPGADLRALTQDETDALIRRGLVALADVSEMLDVIRAVGGSFARPEAERGLTLTSQRGGIDSDPLVRVLARRAWGDRDRQWFELRGVRKGEVVAAQPTPLRSGEPTRWRCALAWSPERYIGGAGQLNLGTAAHDARPGEGVEVATMYGSASYLVTDRLREEPDDQHPWMPPPTSEQYAADLNAAHDRYLSRLRR